MARILLIETSTEVCSVALSEGGEVVSYMENREGTRHAELLTVFIKKLYDDSGWTPETTDAVCVSRGPGSYTGLRIGVSVAKGFCFGLGIPLIAVSTLQAMAWHVASGSDLTRQHRDKNTLLCPMLDARRSEVYTAMFDHRAAQITPVSAMIITPGSFGEELAHSRILFFGNGAAKCQQLITGPNAVFPGPVYASARFMSYLAGEFYNKNIFENVAYFEPFYLKDFIATVPKNKVF